MLRERFEILLAPGEDVRRRLVDWALATASTVGAVWPDGVAVSRTARVVLDAFEAAHATSTRVSRWPGVELVDAEATLYSASPTDDLSRTIRAASRDLVDWRAPALPEDLHFLRDDGSTVVGFVSAEEYAWTELSATERSGMTAAVEGVELLAHTYLLQLEHPAPVWRTRGNVVVEAQSRLGPAYMERLWCKAIGDGLFEVCCIPFNVLGISLGDTVEARPRFDGAREVISVKRRSGRSVAWVSGRRNGPGLIDVQQRLDREAALYERDDTAGSLAVDIPRTTTGAGILAMLQDAEDNGSVELYLHTS